VNGLAHADVRAVSMQIGFIAPGTSPGPAEVCLVQFTEVQKAGRV
jgi:hypothetical protein